MHLNSEKGRAIISTATFVTGHFSALERKMFHSHQSTLNMSINAKQIIYYVKLSIINTYCYASILVYILHIHRINVIAMLKA